MQDYYNSIKDRLIRNEINHRIKDYSKNKGDLETYYEVGKLLVIAQGGKKRAKYGDGLIKEYAKRLTKEMGKTYSISFLKRTRQFYLLIEKGAAMPHQLTWSHYQELLPIDDTTEINYYIDMVCKENISYRELRKRIKSKVYERLPLEYKQNRYQQLDITQTIKEPILISNTNNRDIYKEEMLQKLIIENYQEFLSELGEGYSLVGNEYRIKLDNNYHRIDLLLFNVEYNCYVVVELKIGKLKKEHIGQVEMYMNYIDENIKKDIHNKTIGIILCHINNKLLMRYCSNSNVIAREYIVN